MGWANKQKETLGISVSYKSAAVKKSPRLNCYGFLSVSKPDDDAAVLCVDGGDAHGVGDHDLAE